MNNKFESKSEAHARQYLTEMFEAGNMWHDGTRDFKSLDRKYFFFDKGIHTSNNALDWDYYDYPTYELKNPPIEVISTDPNVKLYATCNSSVYVETQPFITPDFSELKVGDKVKCVLHGDGVADIVRDPLYPIHVNFTDGSSALYTKDGRGRTDLNPTLFYPFQGQFPTAEACKRPKPDPYELHGVTREEIKKYVEAVELLHGEKLEMIEWYHNGLCYFTLSSGDEINRVAGLRRPSPYPHHETPIILGGE